MISEVITAAVGFCGGLYIAYHSCHSSEDREAKPASKSVGKAPPRVAPKPLPEGTEWVGGVHERGIIYTTKAACDMTLKPVRVAYDSNTETYIIYGYAPSRRDAHGIVLSWGSWEPQVRLPRSEVVGIHPIIGDYEEGKGYLIANRPYGMVVNLAGKEGQRVFTGLCKVYAEASHFVVITYKGATQHTAMHGPLELLQDIGTPFKELDV